MTDIVTFQLVLFAPVKYLKPGDVLDLQYDIVADPHGNVIYFEFEYVTIDDIDRETDACVAVCIANVDTFGFPPDHLVKVVGRNSRYGEVVS